MKSNGYAAVVLHSSLQLQNLTSVMQSRFNQIMLWLTAFFYI